QTQHCWYVPLTKQDCRNACDALKNFGSIDATELKAWLEKRKTVAAIKNSSGQKSVMGPKTMATYAINDENLQQLDIFVKTLELKAYSTNTIRLYKDELVILMRLLRNRSIRLLQTEHIKSY